MLCSPDNLGLTGSYCVKDEAVVSALESILSSFLFETCVCHREAVVVSIVIIEDPVGGRLISCNNHTLYLNLEAKHPSEAINRHW